MRTTVYARLFDRLADLIPSLQSARAGAVFCAPPRIPDDMAVYCHIAAAEGDMRLIELADDNQKKGTVMPAPCSSCVWIWPTSWPRCWRWKTPSVIR